MRIPSPFALLAAALGAAIPDVVSARETVLEDSPSRLILEVEVPEYAAQAAGAGTRVSAPGYGGAGATGAPDLPWMRFTVATGDRAPGVSIEPLEWLELETPGGLAGVPRWITNKQSEPARDAALFNAARGLAPSLSDIRLHRGMKLREIALPLGTYTGGETVRLLKRFRVRVDFPNPGAAPAAGVAPWLAHAGVKNPSGGRYLTSIPRGTPLRRTAAGAAFDPAVLRIKITIGDREVEGFAEDGLYAVTYQQLVTAGLPATGGIPVSKLKLYAGPNDALPVGMGALSPATLHEVPIEVRDNDSTFGPGDSILFYAHGTSLWKPIPGATGPVRFAFTNDPWSYENRYYLQWDGSAGQRLGTAAALATTDTVTRAPHYLRAERDLATGGCDPAGSFDPETGAFYWHSRMTCNSTSAPVTLSGASQLRPVSWDTDTLMGRAAGADSVWIGMFMYGKEDDFAYTVYGGGSTIALPSAEPGIPGAWFVKTSGGRLLDSVRWAGTVGITSLFDGYTVRYARDLKWSKGRFVFPAAFGSRVAYKVSSAPAGLRVLRVRDGEAQRWLAVTQVGETAAFADSAGEGEDVRYVLHAQAPLAVAQGALAAESPSVTGVLQNLATGDGKDPEYLIIAPQALLPEAVQLRDYRDNAARLTPLVTAVARTEDIYREWSGGRMSPPAIRDMLRWAVSRWGGGGTSPGRLKYVLLFGDGHYDYRNIRNAAGSPNHIPPYNLQEGDGNNPMSTDDFYGVLDSGQTWGFHPPILALGRLGVQTREQAANYLQKVARYEDPKTAGEWRSRFLMVGDDNMQRDAGDGAGCHTCRVETTSQLIVAGDSGMRKETVYLFDYPRNAAYLKPGATQDLMAQYNRGVLYSTFYGHGAYNQLADEVLLKSNDGLARLRNVDKNFFMTLFSCTVGRFDKLADEGMSEQFVRQRDYAAIGAVSASRETYDGPNAELGNAFVNQIFSPEADSIPMFTGEAMRRSKQSVSVGQDSNRQKYILQAEPVLVINRPGLGLALDAAPDTLRSLGCDSLRGRVTRGSGRGAVSVRIVSGDLPKMYPDSVWVKKRGQILFERTVPYVDSVFSLRYFLPSDVPYGDSTAKIQIFAWDSVQLREEALLVSNLRITSRDSTTASCLVNDQRGPRIAVTGCNEKEAGNVDFPDKVSVALPYCLQITVSDTGAGVLAGDGPDQGVTVEVVGSMAPFQPQAGVDDLYRKTYQVPLSGQQIAEGTHLLTITARDGFRNLTKRQITLQVTQDTALRFVRAFNVPNPMKRNGTTFWFSTTLPVEEGGALLSPNVDRVRFHVRVFNQQGYMVREFRDAVSGGTTWDGKDAWGRQLANGVYFYDVTADWSGEFTNGAPPGGRKASKRNVLVISR